MAPFAVALHSRGVDNGAAVTTTSSYHFWKCERNMLARGDGNNGTETIDQALYLIREYHRRECPCASTVNVR